MPDDWHRSLIVCFVFSLIPCLVATDASQVQFVYSGFRDANLSLEGVAELRSDGLVQLTNNSDVKGYAFYPIPVHFRNTPNGTVQSFSVSFVFGIRSAFNEESLDGMTFFISPSKDFSSAFANHFLGLFNDKTDGSSSNHVFAVELDTYKNPELKDIDDNHIGIDINSLISIQTGKFTNLTLGGGEPMQLWVDYDAHTLQIMATLAPLGVAKPQRALFSATTNLSNVLKEPSYIGFSGATGPISTLFYLLGWSFGINSRAPAISMTNLPKLPHGHQKSQSVVLEITLLPVGTSVCVLALGTTIVLLIRRRSKYAEIREDWEAEFGPHRFSYKELYCATDGFSNKLLIGIGGFGKVYKGILPATKLEVAIKKVSHESRQGMKEFITEIVTIGRLRHRNLVQLLGYCRRKDELILVYEYMPNGSLDKYLYSQEKPVLGWTQRLDIIKGVASGLLYLHEKWEKVVLHRDIKAGNVLLDIHMNGRLGDFGLARLYDHGTNAQTTHVVGTMGYLAPELLRTGKSSPLTDVFAFGVFLLEVTCGQRPIHGGGQDTPFLLAAWVLQHCYNGSLLETVDWRLGGNYHNDEADMVLKLGLFCLHPLPTARPSMRQVMQYLDGDMPLPDITQTCLSTNLLSMMQHKGFRPSILSYPDLSTSAATFSGLSGGR
ncbi:hypothetical protein HU200_048805 [Digitaria exilis]|uniref:non-specific serine/threonine protein kinase n=1 Tax=Digitaria exilis TaxID=1010633 RepID=A0A835E8Z4_9POAL|nr:hypothetical protein HU200_048805 [Digitaria exilis]